MELPADLDIEAAPAHVFSTRVVTAKEKTVKQYLIHWKGLSAVTMATWEDEFVLINKFLTCCLEYKASSSRGGVVRPIEEEQALDVAKIPKTWQVYVRRKKYLRQLISSQVLELFVRVSFGFFDCIWEKAYSSVWSVSPGELLKFYLFISINFLFFPKSLYTFFYSHPNSFSP